MAKFEIRLLVDGYCFCITRAAGGRSEDCIWWTGRGWVEDPSRAHRFRTRREAESEREKESGFMATSLPDDWR